MVQPFAVRVQQVLAAEILFVDRKNFPPPNEDDGATTLTTTVRSIKILSIESLRTMTLGITVKSLRF